MDMLCRLLIVLLALPLCLGAVGKKQFNASNVFDMGVTNTGLSSLDRNARSSLHNYESRRMLLSAKPSKKHDPSHIILYKELMTRKPTLQQIGHSSGALSRDKAQLNRGIAPAQKPSSTLQVRNYQKVSLPAAPSTCSLTGRGRCTPTIRLLSWCVPAFNGPIIQNKRLEDLANWGSCAVVGGGKPRRDYGEIIDNCSAVIRTNDAPVKGYEALVGSKTTVRIQNQDYCGSLKERGTLNICRPLSKSFEKKCERRLRSKCDVEYFSKQFVNFSHKYWMGKRKGVPKISSGFVGIVLGLSICKEVHIFGYSSSPSYYYPKKIVSRYKSRHNWVNEKKCIQYLTKMDHPKIHVYSN